MYNNDIAAARVELWSSSTNAKVCRKQLTTFCVKSKYSINVVSFKKCYNICDMSCIYSRYKNLILFDLF